MIRPYESMIIFDGTLPEDVVQKEQQQLEDFFKSIGTFQKTEVWGKRQLAYSIRKKRSGYYFLFLYEAEGQVAGSLEKHIKLNETILRHLTVVKNPKNEVARAAAAARKDRPEPPRIDEDAE